MRLVVSFTTTPTRIHKIEPMLKSILNQTRQPDFIIANLPNEYIRDKNELIIPDFIKNNEKIIVNRCQDYGPATKLVGVLNKKNIFDKNDYIITVDDDIKYQNNLLEFYEKFIKINNNNVYGLSGFDFTSNGSFNWISEQKILYSCDCLEGWASISYPFKFLKNNILLELKVAPKYLLFSDDVLISNYFKKVTKLILIRTNDFNHHKNVILGYGDEKDALHNQKGDSTHFINYKNSYNYLTSKNKNNMNSSDFLKLFRLLAYHKRKSHRWSKNRY